MSLLFAFQVWISSVTFHTRSWNEWMTAFLMESTLHFPFWSWNPLYRSLKRWSLLQVGLNSSSDREFIISLFSQFSGWLFTFFYSCCCWSLSHVQLFATPWTGARQVSLSLGFPRQEYWGGLPFLSPGDLSAPGIEPVSHIAGVFTDEALGVKNRSFSHIRACMCLQAQLCLTLCDPMDCSPPGPTVPGILQARILKRVFMPSSRVLPNPEIKPTSPAISCIAVVFFIHWATREAQEPS